MVFNGVFILKLQNGSVFDVRVPGNLGQVLPLWQYSTDGKMTAPAFYPGWIWYEREFSLPMEWKESRKRIFLRVGAAHYCSVVVRVTDTLEEQPKVFGN